MADYISNLIIALSTLGAVFLTWLLHYFPERRRKKIEKKEEKKASLLKLVKTYMDDINKLASTPQELDRKRIYNEILLDTEYLDEVIRVYIKIPEPIEADEKDKLTDFLKTSIELATELLKNTAASKKTYDIWLIVYRLLCNVITGEINFPITVDF